MTGYDSKLLDMGRHYNSEGGDIRPRLSRELAYWKGLQPSVQQTEIDKAMDSVRADYIRKLEDVRKDVDAEMRREQRVAERIRFPLSLSDDPTAKLTGEIQRQGAAVFLSGNPSRDALLSALASALSQGRMDYAFSIVAAVDANTPEFPSAEERQLADLTRAAVDAWEGSAGLRDVEKNLSQLQAVNGMVEEFAGQVRAGMERVVLPELFASMTDGERWSAMSEIERRGNLLQSVTFKHRAATAMGMGSGLHLYESSGKSG